MTTDPIFAHDAVAYPTTVVPMMAPERIRAAGVLLGWVASETATARVLEIGGNDGLNAIGIAAASPQARVVAFDLAGEMVARGQRLAAAAGLTNIDLHKGDILTWPRQGEAFDYILCHGVYAWTPAPVRQAVLELIHARLAPGGVAYVSYDCLPAAAAKYEIARFLAPRIRHHTGAKERVGAALEIMTLLAPNQWPDSRLKLQLDIFLKQLPPAPPEYVFHDLLAEHYRPTSLDDFADAAASAGLAIIGDAGFTDIFIDDLDPPAKARLGEAGRDVVARGSLLDMLRGSNMFRRTLLCRADARPREATVGALQSLSFETQAVRAETIEAGRPAISYSNGRGSSFAPGVPHIEAMLDLLIRASPREVPFAELAAAAGSPALPVVLAPLRMACVIDLITPHASPQPFASSVGERPKASPLARAMLAEGGNAVSLRLETTSWDDITRRLACLCDGTRTRAELARDLGASLSDVDASLDSLRRSRLMLD